MFRILTLAVLTLLLLAACTEAAPSQQATDTQGLSVVTVFKPPT